MSFSNISTVIAANAHRTCAAKGCTSKRMPGQAGRLCRKHRKARLSFGHEFGQAIPAYMSKHHRAYVSRLLGTGKNWSRTAVVEALGRIDALLSSAAFEGHLCSPDGTPRQKMLRVLSLTVVPRKVTARELLVNTLGLLLNLRANPDLIPPSTLLSSNDKAVTFAVGRAVLGSTLGSGHAGSVALQTLGETFQDITARVLALTVLAVEEGKRRASDPSLPFDPVRIGRPRSAAKHRNLLQQITPFR